MAPECAVLRPDTNANASRCNALRHIRVSTASRTLKGMRLPTVLSRIGHIVTKCLALPLQQRMEASWLAKTHFEEVLDFRVYVARTEDIASSRAVMRIHDALLLLQRTDPFRFARVRRHLTQFIVSSVRNVSAAHFPKSSTCYLSARFVDRYPVPNLAIAIVHEATHARIDHSGIPLYPDWKARIERRCVLEEIAFAKHLSEAEHPGIEKWIREREGGVATR